MWNHLAATQQLFCFYLLWEQLWAARKPVVEFHCRCLVAPADGDVAQVRASGGLTLWARHKAATSPPDCCRFAGPDPTVSLHKTMVRTWCCCLFIFYFFIRECWWWTDKMCRWAHKCFLTLELSDLLHSHFCCSPGLLCLSTSLLLLLFLRTTAS